MNTRIGVAVILSFLAGAAVASVLFNFSVEIKPRGRASVSTPSSSPESLPPSAQAAPPGTRYETARQLVLAGRLHEAQDEYLEMLTAGPDTDKKAMQALVKVRRLLAREDPFVLRRQAAVYRQAIGLGVETEEHYRPESMEVLVEASLIAAKEIEAERLAKISRASEGQPEASAAAPKSRTQQSQVTAPTLPPQPRAKPSPAPTEKPLRRGRRSEVPVPRVTPIPAPVKPQVTPTPPPVAIAPTPTPTATPEPQDVNKPLYSVQVGRIRDSERASELAGRLTLAGYAASLNRGEEPVGFRVMSAPLPRNVAERRAAVLEERGFRSRLHPLAAGLAQLEFGVFVTEPNAEALARRIRAQGFDATVVREGGLYYVIRLGPYGQSAVDAIVKIVSSFDTSLAVSVSPAP